jgi:hypothetical protein
VCCHSSRHKRSTEEGASKIDDEMGGNSGAESAAAPPVETFIGVAPRNREECLIYMLESPFHVVDWRLAQLLRASPAQMSHLRRKLRELRPMGEQELNAHYDSKGDKLFCSSDRIYWRLGDNDDPYCGQQPHPQLLHIFPTVQEQKLFVNALMQHRHFSTVMETLVDVGRPLRMGEEWTDFLDFIEKDKKLLVYFDNNEKYYDKGGIHNTKRQRLSRHRLSRRELAERVQTLVSDMAFWGCFGRKHVTATTADKQRLVILEQITEKLLEITRSIEDFSSQATASTTGPDPAVATVLNGVPTTERVSNLSQLSQAWTRADLDEDLDFLRPEHAGKVRRYSAAIQTLSDWETGTTKEMANWAKFCDSIDWRDEAVIAKQSTAFLKLILNLNQVQPKGKKKDNVTQVVELMRRLPAEMDATNPPAVQTERALACTVEREDGGYRSQDVESYLVRRLKMFHLVHHLHRVPETERVFCPNLPESRAVGYASHRGKKLTAHQLEEHVRLCIRYE